MRLKLLSLVLCFMALLSLNKAQTSKHQTVLDSSWYYINHGKQVRAIKLLSDYERLVTKGNNKQLVFKIYKMLGKAFYDIGDPAEASLYYTKGLGIAKELNDSMEIGNFYMLLSGSNIHTLNILTLGELNKAEAIFKCLKNQERLNMIEYRRGVFYSFHGNHDSSFYFYNKVIPIYESNGADSLLISIYMNMGLSYGQMNDLAKYKAYALKSIKLCEKLGEFRNLSLNCANLAGYFIEVKKYDSSIFYSIKAIETASKINYLRSKIVAYQNLVEVWKKKNNYKIAMGYYEKLVAVTDSFQHFGKDIQSLASQLQSDFKERETQLKYKSLLDAKEARDRLIRQRLVSISIGVVLLVILLFVIILYNRFKLIKKQNQLIEEQKQSLEQKNVVIEVKQKEIIDSINYAKRIQYTLLAHEAFLNENLPEHFTFFNPKDIVSGDFYWATGHNNKFYLAVCDSTGHGVPGAFMCLLSIGFLSEAINEKGIEKPNEVFDYARLKLTNSISKEGQKDGFDGILICCDRESNTITYAAANNSPVIVRNNQVMELPYDRMPVGVGERKNNFTLHSIEFNKGDMLYLYTDGYADQFGGESGKKFKYKKLNELLQALHARTPTEQKNELQTVFDNWKGKLEQIDDVCIIGIRL